LWKVCKKALDRDKTIFEPSRLVIIRPHELAAIFSDDNGPIPFPDFEERFKMTRAHGRWFVNSDFEIGEPKIISPLIIVKAANQYGKSLQSFLNLIKRVDGYDKDKLEKRQLLLAMVLANRPERFLKVNDPENWKPIVDYHLMRVGLRLGIVELSTRQRYLIKNRLWVSMEDEDDVRLKTRDSVQEIIKLSGKPMSFVD